MSQLLLVLAGLILAALGTLHGVLTLRDVVDKPRAFTPTDDEVRLAMQGTRLRFNRRANLWDAWVGFNLSHSLGVLLSGICLLLLAWHHQAFVASPTLQRAAMIVPALYVAIAVRFWFYGPAIGAGLALLCVLGAVHCAG
jgi:hypothetical protein